MASLLAYLSAEGGGFRLRPQWAGDEPKPAGPAGTGAAVASVGFDADPFTRLVDAEVIADSGSRVSRVVLMIQRDRYRSPGAAGPGAPRNNLEVTELWRQAFQFHSQAVDAHAPLVLSAQIAPLAGFTPFEPLLYCRFREIYFEPSCPECGAALTLCTDEALLERLGLPEYRAGLERFLFCRSCVAAGREPLCYHRGSGFGGAAFDPAGRGPGPEGSVGIGPAGWSRVRSGADLIEDYRRLLGRGDPFGGHPCPRCEFRMDCFGPARKVHQRLLPFSFYPFYALIFPSLPAAGAHSWPPLLAGLPASAGAAGAAGAPSEAASVRAAESGAGAQSRTAEDAALRAIVGGIMARWRAAAAAPRGAAKAAAPGPEEQTESGAAPRAGEALKETLVLLRAEDRLSAPQPAAAEAAPESGREPGKAGAAAIDRVVASPSSAPSASVLETITETIVIHGAAPEGPVPGPEPLAGGAGAAPATASAIDSAANPPTGRPWGSEAPRSGADSLAATLVLNGPPAAAALAPEPLEAIKRQPVEPASAGDDPTATLVLPKKPERKA